MTCRTTGMGNRAKRTPLDGLTEAREYLANHPEITQRLRFQQCLNFAHSFIGHARDLAKTDKKDEARDWWRFFENSHILEILEHEKFDVSDLRADLTQLKTECHPLDVPNFSNDLTAIRNMLEIILREVKGKAEPALTVIEGEKSKDKI